MDARIEEATAAAEGLPLLTRLDEVVDLVERVGMVYLRYSRGPQADAAEQSVDQESGCALPGLSTNPVTPEPWWHRPPREWAARQVRQYVHLGERDDERIGWLLTGREAGRGPDCEPLLVQTRPLAVLGRAVQDESVTVYAAAFDPGRV